MDLHPLVVHFPVALLLVYSILEVLRRWTPGPQWMHTRSVLVILGTIGAFAALSTGETAEHLFKDRQFFNVLETHSLIASITTWIYGILAACYVVSLLQQSGWMAKAPEFLRRPAAVLTRVVASIMQSFAAPVLALLGAAGLGLVGALGGILAYGPNFDPVTSMVYALLFGGQ